MSAGSDYQRLRAHLAFLRMAAAAEALPALLDEATKPAGKLTHQAFLERLLAVEVAAVEERRKQSLARFASLPSPFTLADFDFAAQPKLDQKLIAELATLRFVEDATNILFIGPPGVGKTMLAVGLGHAAVAAGMRVYYTTAAELVARSTGPPWRGGGRPPCASTPDPEFSSLTKWGTCRCRPRRPPPCSKSSASDTSKAAWC